MIQYIKFKYKYMREKKKGKYIITQMKLKSIFIQFIK